MEKNLARVDFLSQRKFGKTFPGLGGKTFETAWKQHPEYVWTTMRWNSADGNLGLWREYCILRQKDFDPEYKPPLLRAFLKKKNAKQK